MIDFVFNDGAKSMAITAIFFDAAGTLIKTARPVGESYAIIAKKYGIDVAPAKLTERFRCCFEGSLPLAFPGATGAQLAALEQGWWKDLVLRVFAPWGPFERLDDYFAELFEYFAGAAAWTVYPEVPATLENLTVRGLALNVISNFDSRLHRIFAGLGIADQFNEVFVSSAVGHAKPDPRIFQAALQRHQLNAAQAVHIGDSEINDVGGAQSAGLKAIMVNRSGQHGSVAAPCVSNLTEIFPLVSG